MRYRGNPRLRVLRAVAKQGKLNANPLTLHPTNPDTGAAMNWRPPLALTNSAM
jgi:hypothetical protein